MIPEDDGKIRIDVRLSSWRNHRAKHRIVLNPPDAPPIHSALYRLYPKQRELERKEVYRRRELGVAEPPMTNWASLNVFVLKKDKSFCFWV